MVSWRITSKIGPFGNVGAFTAFLPDFAAGLAFASDRQALWTSVSKVLRRGSPSSVFGELDGRESTVELAYVGKLGGRRGLEHDRRWGW